MYRRVLLKLSGEALLDPTGAPISQDFLSYISKEVAMLVNDGVQVAVVVGGGNIFRGLQAGDSGIDRVTGDHMGMLATIINSLALSSAFQSAGLVARVMSAVEVDPLAEPFIRGRAIRHLEKGRVVIFGGGTGNPFFTTDTAAALRAVEIGADILIKATKVDGLYDKDPMRFDDAILIEKTTFKQAIEQGLKVMDTTALTLCAENNLSLRIVNIFKSGAMQQAVAGEQVGSLVTVK
ncbi:UMP kinase [bacterium]|nr:UMP kinase [bacterium]